MSKLSLYYPVKPLFINQKFGEVANAQYYHDHGIPIVGHNGIDYMAKHGQPVYAAHDGVAYVEKDVNQGIGVVLMTNEKFDYKGTPAYFKTLYWHLIDNVPYVSGTSLKAGDLIGYANSTGLSTGDHLHFGLKPVENNEPPFAWINIEQANGYFGAIDPAPYLNGLFAEDLRGFIFQNNLRFLDRNEDVRQLQVKLKKLGFFPENQDCTGFYGNITRNAVSSFQLAEVPDLSWYDRLDRGLYFGPKSRAAMNVL